VLSISLSVACYLPWSSLSVAVIHDHCLLYHLPLSVVVCGCLKSSEVCHPSTVICGHLLSIVCSYPLTVNHHLWLPIGVYRLWLSIAHQSAVCGHLSFIVCGCPSESIVCGHPLESIVYGHPLESVICGHPSESIICGCLLSVVIYRPLTIVVLSVSCWSLSAFVSHHREDHLALLTPLDL
jgi:hypothetical protein